MLRLQTAATRNGNPSLKRIWSALSANISSAPEPTFPNPMIPTLTARILAYDSNSLRMPSRAALVLILLAVVIPFNGQQDTQPPPLRFPPEAPPGTDVRLPNGKRQVDEILKSEREKSIEDVKQLIVAAEALQKDLEQKDSQQVLNLSDIHRTEEIVKLAKRIQGRIRHN
jgi:hypothetical protein